VDLASRNCFGRDFSGDQRADVLARHSSSGVVHMYQGNGIGGFLYGSVVGNDWSGFDILVSAWDFDSDGDNDIIARNKTTKDLHLYRGDGTGGFQTGTSRVIRNNWSEFDTIFSVRDFSGDGKSDLLARNSSTGDLHMYRGNGAGGFRTSKGRVIGNNWSAFDLILSPGDFDSDGDNDIIARNKTTKDLHLYRGDGTGGFQSGTGSMISSNWSVFDSIFSVGDFSGDGLPDLIARHATTRDLHLYRGDGLVGFLAGSGGVIGHDWSAFDQLF
jgi:hypothetical protein